jgi:aspartyl-tRNA(Asn)/glutamyl-tRNA(Gln) amidotransferase subunit C
MPSKLTRDDVLRVAALARLQLTDAEVELFARQLAGILEYADAIGQADTSGVPATAQPLAPAQAWREDVPVPSLDRELVLAQAPDAARTAGLFRVPKVL